MNIVTVRFSRREMKKSLFRKHINKLLKLGYAVRVVR